MNNALPLVSSPIHCKTLKVSTQRQNSLRRKFLSRHRIAQYAQIMQKIKPPYNEMINIFNVSQLSSARRHAAAIFHGGCVSRAVSVDFKPTTTRTHYCHIPNASTSEEGGTSFGFCSAICRFVASTPTAPVVIPNCDDGVQSTWRSDEANSFPETNVIESSLTAAPKLLAGGNDGGWFSVLMQAAKHTEFLNTVLPNLFTEWHKTEFNCKTWLKSICNEDNFL